MKIRNLKAEEIECRVGNIMESGISLLLYKNARVDQTVLDETFGTFGWQRSHIRIGEELYCTVSVWDEAKGMWIQKQDVGVESDYEKVKGAASDSFKRACFNLGIGRELYTAPFIFIPSDKVTISTRDNKKYVKDRFTVKWLEISKEKVITGLEIINQKGETVFWYNKEMGKKTIGEKEKKVILKELARTGITEQILLDRYSLDSLDQMEPEVYLRALTALKKTKPAA